MRTIHYVPESLMRRRILVIVIIAVTVLLAALGTFLGIRGSQPGERPEPVPPSAIDGPLAGQALLARVDDWQPSYSELVWERVAADMPETEAAEMHSAICVYDMGDAYVSILDYYLYAEVLEAGGDPDHYAPLTTIVAKDIMDYYERERC